MARSGLRKSDVKMARNSLIENGKIPSVDAVRILLGNTGSKTTIHKYLKEIEKETETAGNRRHETGKALQDLVERLATTLHAEADLQLEEIQAQLKEATQRHETEVAALRAQNEAMRLRLQHAEAQSLGGTRSIKTHERA